MVSCDTLILGSGCWSAGAALSGRGSLLVVDRGAVIGAEYFDTFRPTSGWKSELRSAEARELYRAMADRGGIDGERSDSYLLAPFLYKMLIPHHSKFRLWTETVSIRPDGNGFLVTLFDADGSEEIRAGRLGNHGSQRGLPYAGRPVKNQVRDFPRLDDTAQRLPRGQQMGLSHHVLYCLGTDALCQRGRHKKTILSSLITKKRANCPLLVSMLSLFV